MMIKILKKIVFLLLFVFKNKKDGILVITYHRITEESDITDPLKVSRYIFEKQLVYLKNHYSLISVDDLKDYILSGAPLPKRPCLVTFDDGWRDNYINAFQVLKKHKVPAIIFISTDYIGSKNVFWHEKLQNILKDIQHSPADDASKIVAIRKMYPDEISGEVSEIIKLPAVMRHARINELIHILKKYDTQYIDTFISYVSGLFYIKEKEESLMLSWSEVREMSDNGIGFGSHTKSHAILTQVKDSQIKEELAESKSTIENKLGMSIEFLSYPNGNFNDTIIQIAKNAGYIGCFTCISGINEDPVNLYKIKRKHIREDFSYGITGRFSELFFKIDISCVRD